MYLSSGLMTVIEVRISNEDAKGRFMNVLQRALGQKSGKLSNADLKKE